WQELLPRHYGVVGELHLHAHAARHDARPLQAARESRGERRNFQLEFRYGFEIRGERVFGGHRLPHRIRIHRAHVDAADELEITQAVPAEQAFEPVPAHAAQVRARVDAEPVKARRGFRTDAVNAVDAQGGNHVRGFR